MVQFLYEIETRVWGHGIVGEILDIADYLVYDPLFDKIAESINQRISFGARKGLDYLKAVATGTKVKPEVVEFYYNQNLAQELHTYLVTLYPGLIRVCDMGKWFRIACLRCHKKLFTMIGVRLGHIRKMDEKHGTTYCLEIGEKLQAALPNNTWFDLNDVQKVVGNG